MSWRRAWTFAGGSVTTTAFSASWQVMRAPTHSMSLPPVALDSLMGPSRSPPLPLAVRPRRAMRPQMVGDDAEPKTSVLKRTIL